MIMGSWLLGAQRVIENEVMSVSRRSIDENKVVGEGTYSTDSKYY